MELLFWCKMSGWEFAGEHRHTTADLHSCSARSVSVHFSLHRLAAKHPKSADIMLLSKWHSSGEKLLLNHMQFKWNWNNNPCLKRSIALSYQTLQCVGCFTVLAIRETHCAQGLHLTISPWYTTWIKNPTQLVKKKKKKTLTDNYRRIDAPQQRRVLD